VQAGRVKSGHLLRKLSNLRGFQKVVPKLQANARIIGLLYVSLLLLSSLYLEIIDFQILKYSLRNSLLRSMHCAMPLDLGGMMAQKGSRPLTVSGRLI